MYQAFFSYAREDSSAASRAFSFKDIIVPRLERQISIRLPDDFKIFFDVEGIGLGDQWKVRLENKIDQCSVFISMLSPKYLSREVPKWEYRRFQNRQRTDQSLYLVPILWRGITHLPRVRSDYANPVSRIESLQYDDWSIFCDLNRPKSKDVDKLHEKIDDLSVAIFERYVAISEIANKPWLPLFAVEEHKLTGSIPTLQDWSAGVSLQEVQALVVLPKGTYQFGSPEDEDGRNNDEFIADELTIEERIAIGRYPVTFAEYDEYCTIAGESRPSDINGQRGRHPVVNVSWHDAIGYCNWLTQMTGHQFRLPTEQEWECACRAGTRTPWAFTEGIDKYHAHYCDHPQSGVSRPVGLYPHNAWGIYDMHGNIQEWTHSSWYRHGNCAPEDPGPRVIRGGWFGSQESIELRSAYRNRAECDRREYNIGFRVAVDL